MAKDPKAIDPGERLTDLVLPAKRGAQPPAIREKEPQRPRESADLETDSHRTDLPETRERHAEAPAGAVEREKSAEKGVEKYKVKGVDYTLDELREKGLLQDVIQSAEQFPHIQKKYMDLLEKEKGKEAVTAAPKPPELTPRQIFAKVRQVYAPVIEAMIKADIEEGLIEPDGVDLYPNLVRNAYTRIFYQEDRIQELIQRVNELTALSNRHVMAENNTAMRQIVNGHLDKIQEKGELFTPLKDGSVREGFYEYLVELDPKREQLTGEKAEDYLKAQWLAYNAAAIEEARSVDKEPDDERRLAAGERPGGGRPAARPKKEGDSLEDRLDRTAGARNPNWGI